MFLGIDLGTSGVKLVLTNERGDIVDSSTSHYAVTRPQALWSEQDPNVWWTGCCAAIDELRDLHD